MFIAVLNSKGGVGKSTLAVHAAVWLKQHGVKLAVVDSDAQASTTDWLSRAEPDIRIERCETTAQLAERVPRLAVLHEAIVADGPAAMSSETVALAGLADLVLLPIGPSMMDVRASYRTARLLYRIRLRVTHADRPRVVTVLNRVQTRTRLAHVAFEAVRKYGFPVACTFLCLRQAYAEACGRGSVVWRLGSAGHNAAVEIDRLFGELFDQIVDYRPLHEVSSATQRLGGSSLSPAATPWTPASVPRCLPASAVAMPDSTVPEAALSPAT